ncbi:hypothetical protein GCM10010218_37290 [Streptomyces mashuensis]|uniref:Carrier domain-containing protein n=1 Tax=Streptomyces mashuensis TaxID=33904 RepID=A0A919B4T2_9ACTN|nr:acyl carrier protein [Streptomyces mashuensis]GHF52375.1 hypothetical protein GCM10010218_37290 [Streptomyces mashuensis]
MGKDTAELENELVDWVRKWNEQEADAVVTPETDLSGTGLLDSMALVGLVSYLEERADVSFDFATFDPHGGVTIRGLIGHCAG